MHLSTVRLVPTGVGERGRLGEEENVVDIRLYGENICNGRYSGIYLTLRMIVQANMDPGVLVNTKIMNSVYTRCLSDYNMTVLEAPRKYPGGEGGCSTLLQRLPPFPDCGEPVLCPHVFIFHLVTRQKRWFIYVCYVPLGSAAENEHITKALYHCTDGLN